MTTATIQQPSPPIYCEFHGLGYGCALCLGTDRDISGAIGALPSGAYGVSGTPSSGYPDHDERPAGGVIDPTYTSRITWLDGEPVVTGAAPTDERQAPMPGLNAAPSDAEWCEQRPVAGVSRAKLYGPAIWSLRKLDFDVLAYLETSWLQRLQWQADPRLVESPTTAEGLLDAWPGETTIPAPSPQERKRLRDEGARPRIGYRSEGRQQTLSA